MVRGDRDKAGPSGALSPSGCPFAAVNPEHFVRGRCGSVWTASGRRLSTQRSHPDVWFCGRSRPEGKQARSEPGLAQRPTRFASTVVSKSASSNTYTRTHCHFQT